MEERTVEKQRAHFARRLPLSMVRATKSADGEVWMIKRREVIDKWYTLASGGYSEAR
jgi:hypothetical protein